MFLFAPVMLLAHNCVLVFFIGANMGFEIGFLIFEIEFKIFNIFYLVDLYILFLYF